MWRHKQENIAKGNKTQFKKQYICKIITIDKMFIFLKLTNGVNVIPIKIPACSYRVNSKIDFKTHLEMQST